MKVNKFSKVLGLSTLIAFAQPVGLQALVPQNDDVTSSDFVAFKVNDAKLRKSLSGTDQDLKKITAELDKVFADSQARLQRIVITGYASPDGSYATNAKLARRRTNTLKEYVSRRYHLSKDKIETRYVAEDWTGLEKLVADASLQDLPHRDSLLQIIRSNSKADAKELAIRNQFPQDFQYLKDHCLPQLRRSEYQIQYTTGTNSNLSENDFLGVTSEANEVAATNNMNEELVPASGVAEVSLDNVPETEPQSLPASEQVEPAAFGVSPEAVSEANEWKSAESLREGKELTDVEYAGEVVTDTIYGNSQIVPNDKIVVSDDITHDSINGDAQVRFVINDYSLRPDYRDNDNDLDKISRVLNQVMSDEQIRLRRIIIHGFASPDGPYRLNEKLAFNRANIIRSMVTDRYQLAEDLIDVESTAEDWSGLERLVEQASDADLPHKSAILDVIRSNRQPDAKERILRSYTGDFAYMKEHILPVLRRTDYYVEYVKDNRVVVLKNIPKSPDAPEPVVEAPAEKKPWYLAVKSNLLYDAAVVPNIGVEVYLGKQWTVLGDWFYTWFKNDNKHRYWQGYGGYLGLRKYFGAKAQEHPFTGHHAGVYGLMLTHDVEFGGRGYQMPDWGFGGGVEYGYSAPIARRLNLDFSLGVGFQDGTYYKYVPMDNHYVWQSTHKRHWFGPTKAEVSLVWLIGRGNYHKKYVHSTEGGNL